MTKKLLEWNHQHQQSLIKQGDRSSGNTPLHYAASWGTWTSAKLLLDAYEPSAYQSDSKGSFPIHVAALRNNRAAIEVLLKKCPDCAQLRDAEGRTFLHVAALNGYDGLVWWIASFLRGNPKDDARAVQRFASTMNMQDNQGNTAVHYAAKSRSYRTMYHFIWYRQVRLNLQNNEGKTALDLARMTRPPGLLFALVRCCSLHI
jgi:ankyrin repeat protein